MKASRGLLKPGKVYSPSQLESLLHCERIEIHESTFKPDGYASLFHLV